MMALRNLPIRQKIIWFVMLTAGGAFLVVSPMLVGYEAVRLRREMALDLTEVARVDALNSAAALVFDDPEAGQEILSALRAERHIVRACIYTRDGEVFARYARPGTPADFTPPSPQPAGTRFTSDRLILFQPILQDDRPVGTLYLEADLDQLHQRLVNFGILLGFLALSFCLAAFFFSSRLQRVISKPILDLARTAFSVSVDKDYSIRARKTAQDEVGFLFDRFNEMLGQIQTRDLALQRGQEELEKRVEERTRELQQEIAERKRAERELRQTEAKYRMLVERIPAITYIAEFGEMGRWSYVSPQIEPLLGYSPEEWVSDPAAWVEHIHPADRERVLAEEARCQQTGEPFSSEYRMFARDSRLLWIRDEALRDHTGGSSYIQGVLYDISARKAAEEALREMHDTLAAMIAASPLAIVTLDLEGNVEAWNPAAQRIFGWAPEEVLGRKLPIHANGTEAQFQKLFSVVKAGQGFADVEAQRARKDGAVIDVSIAAAPLRHVNGEVRGVIGMITDITEKKRAARELEQHTAYLNALIENSPLAIVACDAAGRIELCNPAFERLFGYRRQDVTGLALDELVAPPELFEEAGELTHRGRAGETVRAVTRRRRSDGTLVDVELHGVPLVLGGRIVGAYALYQDITGRKRAEVTLNKMSKALEQTADAVMLTDRQGVIEYVNPTFEKQTGYAKEEAVGQTPRILKSGSHGRDFYETFWTTILSGKIFRGVFVNKRKTGELFHEEKTVAPLKDSKGNITHFVSVGRDITAQKQAAEELQKAREAAEAANRAKSEFLASMSHEIRTPMNGILGMTELALDTKLEPEQREYLGMVKASADSLLTLLNEVLDFSKIEAGKLEIEPVEFRLRESLGETLKALGVRAGQKGLELAYRVGEEVPELVIGDPGRLRQVVVNLVGNAIKFTERGEVVVEVGLAGESAEGVEVELEVRDTGIGIPKEKQERIFEAFTQADSSMTRRYGGTGLGLTIGQRLVELMGGRIWVESEEGRGSRFHFTVRLRRAQERRAPEEPVEPAFLHGLPALVVDDNATNRAILTEMLSRWKMRPCAVSGAAEALAEMERACAGGQPYPLVLLDVQMPGTDGFALASRIRSDPRSAGTAIVMLTSSGQRGDGARCREAGVAAYLTKPVHQSELFDAVLTVLAKSSENRPRPLVTRHSVKERRRRGRVLVAEDNLINQRLAVRLLERHGYTVALTEDGRAAVEIVGRGGADLVLMDVQMPGMDGFEAAKAIREIEKTAGGHIPIIATTAHVMKGDRERCLEAGMDDYLTKPIRTQSLLDLVERYLHPLEKKQRGGGAAERGVSSEVFDREAALRQLAGDGEVLADLAKLFDEEWPKQVRRMREALAAGSAAELEKIAHALKGAVGNFAASRAVGAARELEVGARSGDLAGAAKAFSTLEKELEALRPALRELFQETQS